MKNKKEENGMLYLIAPLVMLISVFAVILATRHLDDPPIDATCDKGIHRPLSGFICKPGITKVDKGKGGIDHV